MSQKPKHAFFGSPSSLSRHAACPGNVAYTKDIPDPVVSEHATEGTYFHDMMEKYFPLKLEGKDSTIVNNLKKCKYPGMVETILSALSNMKEKWEAFLDKHTNAQWFLEKRVRLNDDIYGTTDVVFTGVSKNTRKINIAITDYKHGSVQVDAEENLQGIAYILATSNTLNITYDQIGTAVFVINQVRFLDPFSSFSLKGEELNEWHTRIVAIVEKVKAIYNGLEPIEPNLHPGPHCRWCKANGKCVAQQRETSALALESATELPIEERVRQLTLDEQVQIYLKKEAIETFLEAIEKNLYSALSMGITHQDIKLVAGRGRRQWLDDNEHVAKVLKENGVAEPYEKSLIGLGTAEKLTSKELVDSLTVKQPGSVKLAPATHKGTPIVLSILEEIENG